MREETAVDKPSRGLRRNHPVNHLDLGLPACRRGNSMDVCCVSQMSVVFCCGGRSKRIEVPLKDGGHSCQFVLRFGF